MPLELVPETPEQRAARVGTPRLAAPAITPEELKTARPAPDCIVERLLYADVGNLIAPGGVGKTTLMAHMSVCITTGRPVLGETVRKPGPVLLLTAEDSREILVARLRAIMKELDLTDAERSTVMRDLRIADVSGEGFKLTEVIGDVVLPSGNLDAVLSVAREIRPVLIVIDPAVSFGVGESRVNDAEQGLVEAARKLRNELNCAVLYIHHSGKANAREGTLDQYSGRGGSAFADGSRMVHVLQPVDASKWQDLTGETLADGETGLILARPKISYCPPPGDIYIRRRGYHFERVQPVANGRLEKAEREGNQVWQLLTEELRQGRYHSKRTLEETEAGSLTRKQVRSAVAWLEVTGRVEMRKRPDAGQHGAREYLQPIGSPNVTGEATQETTQTTDTASPSENAFLASPPYREINGGEPSRAVLSPCSLASPNSDGEPRRGAARRDAEAPMEAEL